MFEKLINEMNAKHDFELAQKEYNREMKRHDSWTITHEAEKRHGCPAYVSELAENKRVRNAKMKYDGALAEYTAKLIRGE